MALLLSSYLAPQPDSSISIPRIHGGITDLNPNSRVSPLRPRRSWKNRFQCVASQICDREGLVVDRGSVSLAEYGSEEELWAAVRLRIRTFYEFNQSVGLGDHRRSLAEREYEALKDRIDKKTTGFRRVSCINATLPISISVAADAHDLCSVCKFSCKGEERVVVGTLDINQCLRLADELTGKKPEGIGADLTRAYLSNVCVAEEMQRNGLGYALISKSKELAKSWGITDLYVHVAVDNAAAKKLYEKSGFIYEDQEPAWQARFLGRPRRFLLWADLTQGSV